MARDDIAFTYDAAQNPHGYTIAGVGLRDLTARDVAKQPPHIRAAIAESSWYTATEVGRDLIENDAQDAPGDTESAPAVESAQSDDRAPSVAPDASDEADEGEKSDDADDKDGTPAAVRRAARTQKRPSEHK